VVAGSELDVAEAGVGDDAVGDLDDGAGSGDDGFLLAALAGQAPGNALTHRHCSSKALFT
jgi:hypothetical protein